HDARPRRPRARAPRLPSPARRRDALDPRTMSPLRSKKPRTNSAATKKRPGARPRGPDVRRSVILARFRDQIERGVPIIGGGAGTGISAKSEEAGGIDLLIVYNSGRYRMAGRGS